MYLFLHIQKVNYSFNDITTYDYGNLFTLFIETSFFICYSFNIYFVFYDELHNLLDKFYNLGGQPSATGGSGMDKGKEWQMELLMEKLRSKASTFKSLVETAKNLRMAMLVSDL